MPGKAKVPSRARPAPRPTAPPATEHAEQCLLFQWAEHAKWQHPELADLYAIPNAGGFSGGYKANVIRVQRMKREGLRTGVPDVHLPHARGGYHSLYVEMKRERGGRVDPEQSDWHARLRMAGNYVIVCRGWEAARDAIVQYLTQSGEGR